MCYSVCKVCVRCVVCYSVYSCITVCCHLFPNVEFQVLHMNVLTQALEVLVQVLLFPWSVWNKIILHMQEHNRLLP